MAGVRLEALIIWIRGEYDDDDVAVILLSPGGGTAMVAGFQPSTRANITIRRGILQLLSRLDL